MQWLAGRLACSPAGRDVHIPHLTVAALSLACGVFGRILVDWGRHMPYDGKYAVKLNAYCTYDPTRIFTYLQLKLYLYNYPYYLNCSKYNPQYRHRHQHQHHHQLHHQHTIGSAVSLFYVRTFLYSLARNTSYQSRVSVSSWYLELAHRD